MKPILINSAAALLVLLSSCKSDDMQSICYSYHFDQPSQMWEESFPLGNGRIGMMPDGGVDSETIVLNESSVWSGSKQNSDNPLACKSLPKIRELLSQGRNDLAQQLMYESFVCTGKGSGHGQGWNCPYGSYQLLGNLVINQSSGSGQISSYKRELNLNKAIATETFSREGVTFTRTHFASYKDDVCVTRLSADKGKSINFSLSLDRNGNVDYPQNWLPECTLKDGDLVYKGALGAGTESDFSAPAEGMKYGARVRVILPGGGTLSSKDSRTLQVEGADEAIILVGMATDYYGDNIDTKLEEQLNLAAHKKYSKLLKDHCDSFGELFGRVSLDFGHNPQREALPINDRLIAFEKEDNDPSLIALYYQFGRYLLISSTRQGCLPPNLQGLWANTVQTPWNGDYHININLQMNLWPAESGNLGELQLPLVEWAKKQVPSGQHTAKVFYGARGWTAHTPTNVWEYTAPGEHPSWGATNTCAAWVCEHLFDHYLFCADKEYLGNVYPTMKEAALFFVDMMTPYKDTGYLVTSPTTSPENSFYLSEGKICSVVAGSTMDNQIVRELFNNVIRASEILGTDKEFADTLRSAVAKIKPTTIGPDGRIMEWMEPYEEVEPHHRHVSHLFGLYPANEISIEKTPELARAARKSLEVRGDVSTGWSMAWKINFWARLRDGERCYKLLRNLLHPIKNDGVNYSNGGGTYPNLFCAHPPFQIDGNFGGAAGIAEMLVQSQDEKIIVLPAIPGALKNGHFKGLRVRPGAELEAWWEEGKITGLKLKATNNGTFFIKDFMDCPVALQNGEIWTWKNNDK